MKLAAGVIHQHPQASGVRDVTLVRFTLSRDRLSETQLLESAFASPARYVGEILRRLRRLAPEARIVCAFNPYLELDPIFAHLLLARAVEWEPGAEAFMIFADSGGRPLAYLFTAENADAIPPVHLGLLSCEDAALDARLLRASVGAGSAVELVPPQASHAHSGANGFWRLSPAIADAARRAADVLEALPTSERREHVHSGPRTAVIGYHAGDVLFAVQALKLEGTANLCISSVAVLACYADIVAYVAPELECLKISQPIPHRPGYAVSDDHALLWEYALQLEDEGVAPRFWHLVRPFRDYHPARHHLREAMAFALGGEGRGLRAPLPVPMALAERRRAKSSPGRVVVHFEGGWPLKEYPPERRGELLALLVEAGYDPVVLGKPGSIGLDLPAIPYTDLDGFRGVLASAEAFIGCDSFPSHFAQVAGVPTLQLFGSTRPVQTRGVESLRYRYLHHPLPCVPCGHSSICRLDGGSSCQAHATPSEVLSALRELRAPPRRAGWHLADAAAGHPDDLGGAGAEET